MATQTFPFGSYGDAVRAEIDVNDATWRPSRVRCINTSAYPLVATVYQAGNPVLTVTAPANQTSSWNISGAQLGWDSVNGCLLLGDYTLFTRWPA